MESQNTWRRIAPASDLARPAGSHVVPPRKNASTACVRCRERKSKCVGGVPCEPCRRRDTDCVVDEEGDNRRKITVKRKIEELEQDRDLLLRLLDTLRANTRERAPGLLNLIQSNAPLDEIRFYLAESLPAGTVSDSEAQALHALGSNTRRKVMDINRITDIPVHEVPARPWTTITDDDGLVSHLVSLYFTWSQPNCNWVDRGLFIRDMKSKNLDSRFCTPLLVNAVLASACFYSSDPEVFASQDDRTSRGRHFYDETKRLLDREEGRVTLPAFQALGELLVITCVIGKDRLGRQYQLQVGENGQELMLKRSDIIANAGEQGPEMARALDTALCGLFYTTTYVYRRAATMDYGLTYTSTASLSLQKPAVMKKPNVKYLKQDHDSGDTWTPYPKQSEPVAAHTNCVMNSIVDLHVIIYEVVNYFFAEERPPRADWEGMVDSFYIRLQHWSQRLPDCISLGNTSTPAVVDLHMRYYSVILTVFGFIRTQSDAEGVSPESADRAKELRLSAAHNIRALANLHRTKWPLEYAPVTCMQWGAVALFTLLEDVENPETGAAFVDVCIILRAMARRWQLAKGMLRLVQLTVKQMDINLPRETDSLFRSFEAELWKADDRERFSSLYPNFAVAMQGRGESVGDVELENFLEKWDNLSLDADVQAPRISRAGGRSPES